MQLSALLLNERTNGRRRTERKGMEIVCLARQPCLPLFVHNILDISTPHSVLHRRGGSGNGGRSAILPTVLSQSLLDDDDDDDFMWGARKRKKNEKKSFCFTTAIHDQRGNFYYLRNPLLLLSHPFSSSSSSSSPEKLSLPPAHFHVELFFCAKKERTRERERARRYFLSLRVSSRELRRA